MLEFYQHGGFDNKTTLIWCRSIAWLRIDEYWQLQFVVVRNRADVAQ